MFLITFWTGSELVQWLDWSLCGWAGKSEGCIPKSNLPMDPRFLPTDVCLIPSTCALGVWNRNPRQLEGVESSSECWQSDTVWGGEKPSEN